MLSSCSTSFHKTYKRASLGASVALTASLEPSRAPLPTLAGVARFSIEASDCHLIASLRIHEGGKMILI